MSAVIFTPSNIVTLLLFSLANIAAIPTTLLTIDPATTVAPWILQLQEWVSYYWQDISILPNVDVLNSLVWVDGSTWLCQTFLLTYYSAWEIFMLSTHRGLWLPFKLLVF